jgi:hypothetical protein
VTAQQQGNRNAAPGGGADIQARLMLVVLSSSGD